MTEDSRTLPVEFVAGYGIGRELGRGAFGVVYAGWVKSLARPVAVKLWTGAQGDRDVERAVREARYIAKVSHPNVVKVYDAGAVGGRPFVVMELLEGGSLADRLRKGPMPLADALAVGIACFEGLAACHAAELIHRDIKPANILFGADDAPRLADFGVALDADSHATRLTASGYLMGTPYYMAPEVMTGGGSSVSSDLYALGMVVYECLAGRAPYLATRLDRFLAERLAGPPTALDAVLQDVPPALVELQNRLCAPSPDARPKSAADVVRELRAIAAAVPRRRTAKVPAAPPAPAPVTRRQPLALAAVASFALGLAMGTSRTPSKPVVLESTAPSAPAVASVARTEPRPDPARGAEAARLLEQARFLLNTNHPDQALQVLGEQGERIEASAAAGAVRGHALAALLRGTDAERCFRDAISLGGEPAPRLDARLGLARALISRGALGEARETLDDALREAASDAMLTERVGALVLRGELARIERRWPDAAAEFQGATQAAQGLKPEVRAAPVFWIMHLGFWKAAQIGEIAGREQPSGLSPQGVMDGAIDAFTR